jgi:uncharacterized membrane protein YeaQ/YmgE (transglycosylase-associated protein family)
MYIVTILLVGLVIGALAKFLMSAPSSASVISTTMLGVAGALVAGMIGRGFGWYATPYHLPGIAASIIGAMLVLFIHRLTVKPRGTD